MAFAAASLPQGWITVGHVKAAWEIRGSGFKNDDLCAYIVIGDRDDIMEGTVPPGVPASGTGEQDLFCLKHGEKKSTCIAFRVSNVNEFSKKWTLCLDSSEGASSKLDLTVTRISNTLPDGVQVKLEDANGKTVADFSNATESLSQTVTGVALGEYKLVVSYVLPAIEVDIPAGIELASGWNLIDLPFDEIIEAKINGKSLFADYAVYRMDSARRSFVRAASADVLKAGEGLWVYLPDGGVLTGKGMCTGGNMSAIPEHGSSAWQCLGVVLKCDLATATTKPVEGVLPVGSRRWDAKAMRFVSASGTPAEYVGYFLR